ncbi:MAG TPA: transglycosylase SLT domain-containing protein [Pseudobdellovibrionaceae bacterium]|nr:transglycosylase SLT domain-containing protein [Pseudobdellovibrionaceae bacterium]
MELHNSKLNIRRILQSAGATGSRGSLSPWTQASRWARLALTLLICVQLGVLPVAHAITIQIREDIKVRQPEDQQMERVGLLKAGSVIQIPDFYRVYKNGRVDLELTLNNWLRHAGHNVPLDGQAAPGVHTFDGERRDYFFPVRVIHAAPGSSFAPGKEGGQHFIALRHLSRRGQALIVRTDAHITAMTPEPQDLPTPVATTSAGAPPTPPTSPPAAAPAARPVVPQAGRNREVVTPSAPAPVIPPARPIRQAPPRPHVEAAQACPHGHCQPQAEAIPRSTVEPFQNLVALLQPSLQQAEARHHRTEGRTLNDLRGIEQRFQQSCGFSLRSFLPVVKEKADQYGIPADVLLGLMTQESSGRCNILNSESNNTQSVGLFQVNSSGSRIPRCSSAQKAQLQRLSVAELAGGPRCLENAVVNLDEAIRILLQKRNTLTAHRVRAMDGRTSGFEPSRMSNHDLWRLTVSAYNGGEGWVLQAKVDLERFNRQHRTQLDAHNWEDLRVFYLRRQLDSRQQTRHFGEVATARSIENAINNLAYAENIVPRDAQVSGRHRRGMAYAWRDLVERL